MRKPSPSLLLTSMLFLALALSTSVYAAPQFSQELLQNNNSQYAPVKNYALQINVTDDICGIECISNATIEVNFSGTATNYSSSGVACGGSPNAQVCNNTAGIYWINFTTDSTKGVSNYQYRWIANNTTGVSIDNATADAIYVITQNATNNVNVELNSTLNTNRTYMYPEGVNATGYMQESRGGTILLWRDEASVSGATEQLRLGNGTFAYKANTSGNVNYTSNSTGTTTYAFVLKGNVSVFVTASPNVTYPNSVTVNCTSTATVGDQLSCSLFRDGTNVTNINDTAVKLGAATYAYIANYTTTANYTTNTTFSIGVNVTQNTTNRVDLFLNGTLNSNRTYMYPELLNATAVNVTLDEQVGTVNLYRDGVAVSGTSELVRLGNGTFAYKANITGNQNYSTNSTGVTFYAFVLKGNVSVFVTASPNVTYPNSVTVNCTSGVPVADQVICSLFRNDTNVTGINNTAVKLGAGAYTYIANYSTTANYTTNTTSTIWVNVTQNTSNPVNLFLNGTLNSNRNYMYPESINATAVNVTLDEQIGTVNLYRDGTAVSGTSELVRLGNGTFAYKANVTGNQNYSTNSTGVTFSAIVWKGNVSVFITSAGNVTYPNSVTVNCTSTVTVVDQISCSLFRNDTNVSSSENNTAAKLGAGLYIYLANYTTTGNYTTNTTSSMGVNVAQNTSNPVNVFLNGTANSNRTYMYPESVNATAALVTTDETVGTLTFFRDDTAVSGNTEQLRLGNGTFTYKANVTGNANYSNNFTGATFYVFVQKGNLSIFVTSAGNVTYPNQVTVNCTTTATAGDQAICSLFRNDTNATSQNNTAQLLGSALYIYVANYTTTANYTANATSNIGVNVAQNTSTANLINLSLGVGSGASADANLITGYPSTVNATATSISSVFSGQEITLTHFRNTTTLNNTNGANSSSERIELAVGFYNYTLYTAGNQNYSSASKQFNVTVQQATANLSIAISPSTTVTYGNGVTATGSGCGVYLSQISCTLYRGNSNLTNPESATLSVGTYIYAFTTTGNQNFSSGVAANVTVTVQEAAGGGGGVGGGGGGGIGGTTTTGTAEVTPDTATLTFNSIDSGKTATVSVGDVFEGAVRALELTVSKSVGNVKVIIENLEKMPDAIKQPVGGKVLKFIDISAANLADSLKSAKIKFAVPKKWISENRIDANSMALVRYNNGWIILPTSKISEDSSELIYEAETPGFSVFAIAAIDAFTVTPDQIVVTASLGGVKERLISITNKEDRDVTITLSTNLDDIALSQDTLRIEAGATATVTLKFVGNKFGINSGELVVKSDKQTKKIPIAFSVQSEKTIFDAKIEIPASSLSVVQGGSLNSQITIFRLGELNDLVEADVRYVIKDSNNKEIYSETEMVAVRDQRSYSKSFNMPANTAGGFYVLGMEVAYEKVPGEKILSTSTAIFRVEEAVITSTAYLFYALIIIFLVVLALIVHLLIDKKESLLFRLIQK